MKYLSKFLIATLFFFGIQFSNAQSFSCDGTFYVSLNQSQAPTTFYEITTTAGVNFDELFSVDLYLNAIGLSTQDQNIYAVQLNNGNDVFQIQANGIATSVFNEPELGSWSAAAGAVNNNGVYAVHDRNMDMIFLYQTGASFTKLGSTTLFWDSSTGNTGVFDHNIDDLVFDPFDDSVMYTYQRFWDTNGPVPTRGHLLRVNLDMTSPDFGMVSSVGLLDPDMVVHLGSLFFDTNGALHGYGANTTGPIDQNRLLKINQNDATIELLGIGPSASGVDGCSCRNPMTLTKTVELIETTCDTNIIRYTVEAENLSILETSELKLKDTLNFNGIIENLEIDNLPTAIPNEGGNGTDFFILEGFTVPGSSTFTMRFDVKTPMSNAIVSNQARLYESEGSPIDSDNPLTIEIADATDYELPELMGLGDSELEFSICEGESVIVNGVEYDMSGMYVDTITINGCDSILNITVDISAHTIRDESVELCPGENIVINGITYNEAGEYVQNLSNVAGCDSTINLLITVDNNCSDCADYSGHNNSISVTKLTNAKSKVELTLGTEISYLEVGNSDELEGIISDYLNQTYPDQSPTAHKNACKKLMRTFEHLSTGKNLRFK